MKAKTIGQVAKSSGVSERTLRYYEELGILMPERTAAGYRVYREADERRLAQIMAMRRCGLPLTTIGHLVKNPAADIHAALVAHLRTLRAQGKSVEAATKRTLAALESLERIQGMKPQDAFEQLKREGLEGFEREYGQEARERYGDAAIEQANQRMMALTKDEWDAKELLEESIKVQLRLAMATGDPASAESNELARMHERWIAIHWGSGYEKETYLGLVRGYLADPRFTAYYDDACGEGATEFLVKAVEAYQG
ncbi:MerR family transcriptional regulator [Parvibacter caecicola]|uniref:MerR family transcriptional regulator n=1 Tax=Parvibacter caecicola TaxID=747645 RepID=UPI00249A8971|nr:MerR family transcriptional regulator [Parvibacter caecicola]